LLCNIAGYVGWCCRSFYLPPPLEFVGDVSPGGRRAAEEWRKSDSYAEPLELTWNRAWWKLCHPWDCVMTEPVKVEEQPDSGLWATNNFRFWGFAKTNGEWDASTAFDRGDVFTYLLREEKRNHRQGEIASTIDAMGANGATIEVLSLGLLSPLGAVVRQTTEAPDLDRIFPASSTTMRFSGASRSRYPATASMLDCLARSIREADVDGALPGWGISPRHGIILTTGDVRAEYLVSVDDGGEYAFGHGIDGIGGFHGNPPSSAGKSQRGPRLLPDQQWLP
jgi:hypothetical protein